MMMMVKRMIMMTMMTVMMVFNVWYGIGFKVLHRTCYDMVWYGMVWYVRYGTVNGSLYGMV